MLTGATVAGMADAPATNRLLMRYMWLSLGVGLTTMAVKGLAAGLTGSVGLLSDALESGVNVVAALVGLAALRAANRPADHNHHFGHGNAEYLSAAVEGTMIFVAAAAILWTAVDRLLNPVALDQTGLGLGLSVGAALLNLAMGLALVRTGKRHRSVALEADGKHLLTDVWTSAGVVVGVALVAILDWEQLDPIVALVVGANILYTGYGLVRRSVIGLLGAALPDHDVAHIDAVIARYRKEEPVLFHDLRTREAGRQRFVYVHMLVPASWTVQQAHDLANRVETDIETVLPGARSSIHLEPLGDITSYDHPGADDERPAPLPQEHATDP